MENSKAVTIFQFKRESSVDVRTVMQDGEPWFAAADVCKILDIADVKQAIERLDDDERGWYIVPSPGGQQTMNCVSESGLYHLIFTSRKEEAKIFRRWVTQEVLPSIRKTGQYSIKKKSAHQSRVPVSTRRLLPPAEKDQFIFHVVNLLGVANGRDVGRHCKWYPIKEARRRMAELAEAGELVEHPTRKTVRYSLPGKQRAS